MSRLFVWLGISFMVLANDSGKAIEPDLPVSVQVINPVADKYSKIDFNGIEKLDYNVFVKAYVGYLNLHAENKLNTDKQILTVCDYSLSSTKNRMWVIDLANNKILLNTYVAHGQGTGEEYANLFSNKEGSHQSSMGFYITGDTYIGSHGNSLYLHGMDEGYNSAAYERSIVMHGAGYVSKDFIAGTGRLGRSWGCPAVSTELCDEIIDYTKEGTCLFIYYPEQKYMEESYWLNKKITPAIAPVVTAATVLDTVKVN
jgi:hypothetical protein